MKRVFKTYIVPVISLILLLVVWTSAEFLKGSSDFLGDVLKEHLPFEGNPARFGGALAVEIYDDIGDAVSHDGYADVAELVDIMTYTVRKPNVYFGEVEEWNIDLGFRTVPINERNTNHFDLIKGVVYIDINDGKHDGCDRPYSEQERVQFSAGFMWDYYVEFDPVHPEGLMVSYATGKTYMVEITFDKTDQTIRMSLPLVEKLHKDMDVAYMGRHIAAAGVYTDRVTDTYVPVLGDKGNTAVTYLDIIGTAVTFEQDGLITAGPVTLDQVVENNDNGLAAFKKDLQELQERGYTDNYAKSMNPEFTAARDLYKEGKLNEAESVFMRYKETSSIANAYLGVIQAVKAGGNDVGMAAKLDLVNRGFAFFDRAYKLVENDDDRYVVLTNRIGVAVEVPDAIFGKLALAERDIEELLTLDLSEEEKAEYYLHLLDIYEKKDRMRDVRLLMYALNG